MNSKIFCPQCGKTGVKLFNGLCSSCFTEKTSLIKVPHDIDITICAQCGSIQKKGKWLDSTLTIEDTVIKTVSEHVELDKSVSDVNISIQFLNIRGSVFECLVNVDAEVLGERITREFVVNVKINKSTCIACSKYASGYYEAVIQLRADSRFLSNEEIEVADKCIMNKLKSLSKKDKMAYISQRIAIKEGIDYYVGSYKSARKLVETLKNEFGGVSQESPRIMGRDKDSGKDLYRVWISLRLSQFQKFDFVEYDDIIAQVENFTGSKIYLKDLKTRNLISVKWNEYHDLNVIAKKEEIRKTIVTAVTPKSIQILHPDTYQPIDIELDEELSHFQISEELEVVEINNILYILS